MTHGIEINPAVLAMVTPGAKLRRWRGIMTDHPTSQIWHVRAVVDDNVVVCRVWRSGRGWVYDLFSMYQLDLEYQSESLQVAK